MQLRGALLAASLLALPIVASAQPVTGLYIGAGVGVNLMNNENVQQITSGNTTVFPSTKLGSRVGPAGVISVGWGLGNGLRFEAEGDFRANKFNTVNASSSGNTVASAGGWEQKGGAMANVLYDFVGLTPIVQPYVGVGVGYMWVDEQNVRAFGDGDSVALGTSTKGSFAYQAILGVALPVTAAPGLAVTLEYRFMGLAGNRTYSGVATSATGVTRNVGVQLNDNYNSTFLVGLRYNFGQVPPPAPAPVAAPAPAVQPARSYLVFFDWDKATLTDRARQIIREAADNSTHVQYTRIEVNGYTDTSGTPQYNMGLSIRRATAVKSELIKDGVPVGAITTQGFGETHLLVPTGAGVREPQNRRVEIIIR
jgi:OOP family OmpA-OmpF porin